MALGSCSSKHTAYRVHSGVVCIILSPILAGVLGSLWLDYPTHLIHIAGSGHLGCFQFLATVNMITKKFLNSITCVLI